MEKKKSNNIFYRAYKKMFSRGKMAKQLLLWYSLVTVIGAILLFIPISKTDEAGGNFLDYLFVSASAFSDTGLTTLSISETFNILGQLIIFSLIILGGIGFFTLKIFLFRLIFFRRLTEKEKLQVEQEMGFSPNYHAADIIKVATISVFVSVFVFGTIFGILFATVEPQPVEGYGINLQTETLQGDWGKAMWTGYFHAASSVNNAGFDIFYGNVSMASYYGNIGIQILTLFLFVFGGIGFAVIYDLKNYVIKRSQNKKFRFTLFTKIAVTTYFIVAFIGLSLAFIIEGISHGINPDDSFYGNDAYGSNWEKTWAIVFNTFSTRNAGFSTINIDDLNESTQLIYSGMMFIGSGPGSTAGGIRTTTTFIIFMLLVNRIRRKKTLVVFNRQIDESTIKIAKNIFIFALGIIFLSSIFVAMDQVWINGVEGLNYIDAIFISASAFGTVGLSTFNPELLDPFAKIWLILIMFGGQAGIINVLNTIKINRKNIIQPKNDYRLHKTIHLTETIFLG